MTDYRARSNPLWFAMHTKVTDDAERKADHANREFTSLGPPY